MNVKEYRTLFVIATLGLALIAAAPALSVVVPFLDGSKRFSELWLLGPGHIAKDYPSTVKVGEEYSVFVGLSNRAGCPKYYIVYVKFRNETQPLPDSLSSKPSPLKPLYEFQVFLTDGENWESPLIFSVQGEPTFIKNISINGVVLPVNCSSTWNSHDDGFFYQLFLELWVFDETSSKFQYYNQFVGLWLKTTT